MDTTSLKKVLAAFAQLPKSKHFEDFPHGEQNVAGQPPVGQEDFKTVKEAKEHEPLSVADVFNQGFHGMTASGIVVNNPADVNMKDSIAPHPYGEDTLPIHHMDTIRSDHDHEEFVKQRIRLVKTSIEALGGDSSSVLSHPLSTFHPGVKRTLVHYNDPTGEHRMVIGSAQMLNGKHHHETAIYRMGSTH